MEFGHFAPESSYTRIALAGLHLAINRGSDRVGPIRARIVPITLYHSWLSVWDTRGHGLGRKLR